MRNRIVFLSVGMTLLVVLAFAVPLALLIRENVESKRLAEARFEAENVALFISSQNPQPTQVTQYLRATEDRYPGTTWVELPGDELVGSPPANVAAQPSADDDDRDHDLDDGVSSAAVDYRDGGAVTRVQATSSSGLSAVYVFLSDDQLHDGQLGPLLALGGVSVALVLLSLLAAEALSRRLARPLEQTAEAAARLAGGDVDARAPETGAPEVARVGVALNRLAARVDEVIAVERESVADLSHRLRTPLTALRLDVDALDDAETADRIGSHVTILERTLTAIIHAARRPQREGRAPHADAVAVVRDRAGFWSALAEDQGRDVAISLPAGPEPVRAAAEDLAAALDALIENVIAHTPEGSALEIRVTADGASEPVSVVVADEGPGIAVDAGRRGRSDRGSSGLGLDIARRCAEASGGRLTLTARQPRGAQVEMTLGRP
jgi:signal transduction histidine kinase